MAENPQKSRYAKLVVSYPNRLDAIIAASSDYWVKVLNYGVLTDEGENNYFNNRLQHNKKRNGARV